MTYICRGHRIQLLLVARVAALASAQVQWRSPMNSASTARVDPRLSTKGTAKLVLLLLQSLSDLFIALLLARLVLWEHG